MLRAKRGGSIYIQNNAIRETLTEQQTTMGEGGTMMLKNHAMFGEESLHSTTKQHKS